MSVQKRQDQTVTLVSSASPRLYEEKDHDSLQNSENHNEEHPQNACDSDGSSHGENDEFIVVQLEEISKELQCPICLGIIKKTRTFIKCLHRFCRDCIEKSIFKGNNECPICRTHFPSRRSLRVDQNFDALIAALYPDIDKHETETQDSITEASRRQVNRKKRKPAKAKKQGNHQQMQGQEKHLNGLDEEVARWHNGCKDSSSPDDHSTEFKSKRYKRSAEAGNSQPSLGANANDAEMNSAYATFGSTEFPAWGGGGMRSNSRHGGSTSTNNRPSNSDRIARLIEHLKGAEERDKGNFTLSFLIVTLEEEKMPKLETPYFSCPGETTVGNLCQEVAKQTSLEASEIEMLLVKGYRPAYKNSMREIASGIVDPSENELLLLGEHMTLEEIHTTFHEIDLALGYRLKAQARGSS